MARDPMHLTVCDRCYRGTWYAESGPCRMSRLAHCPTCGQSTGDVPCGGTLRVINRSSLAPAFASAYESGERIRVRFASGEEMTGTVGKTSGWQPCYLLMRRATDAGSIYTLAAGDRIVAVKRGSRYVATYA